MFVIQYKFNVSVCSPLASININYTLLASSSPTSVKVTESWTDTNLKPAMEADATSGKKNVYRNFIYNEFTFKYPSWYIEKNGKISQRYLKKYGTQTSLKRIQVLHHVRYLKLHTYV